MRTKRTCNHVASLFLLLCCLSCNTGKPFFDYDEIDYYTNRTFSQDDLPGLWDHQERSAFDSMKSGVITDDIPRNVKDLSFIDSLPRMGYEKRVVDQSKFADIGEIFSEKEVKNNVATTCIYIYRDILIFKKQGAVIGTAKICFGCMDHQITGSKAQTGNFGQDGDYDKLEQILSR
ncbi:MAG: hypothetical protein EOP49_18870 [Sphingobacteriales bacterium]|nr:MAG: hypothetical protein EOP49_18870 [Sphingobacteriales bacterium]